MRDAVDLLLDAAEGAVGEVDDLLAQARGDRGFVAAAGAALVAVGLLVIVILYAVWRGSVKKSERQEARITCEKWLGQDKRQAGHLGRELKLAAYPYIASSWDCTLRRPVCGRNRPCLELTTCNWFDGRRENEVVVDRGSTGVKFRDVSSESGTGELFAGTVS
jgi:hypothetical protein